MEILEEVFHTNGFTKLATNSTGISIFLNRGKDRDFLVILFYLFHGNEWSNEQCSNMEVQILKALKSEAKDLERITLLITMIPEAVRPIYRENNHTGVIDLRNSRLLLFEGMNNDSLGILKGVEQMLERHAQGQDLIYPAKDGITSRFNQTPNHFTDDNKSDISSKTSNHMIAGLKVIGKVSLSLVVINILIFAILKAGGWYKEVTEKGSLYWYAVDQNHEYYRLFSSMFLHADLEHLLYNMLMLGAMGDSLEKTIGKLKFLLTYLIAGIVAAIASMSYNMMKDFNVQSIGASGAIFGIIGALLFIVLRNKGRVNNLGKQQMLIFVAMTLYGGFRGENIDNVAHIGGLIAGVILGFILYRKPKKRGVIS